jgi:hypothetical protein
MEHFKPNTVHKTKAGHLATVMSTTRILGIERQLLMVHHHTPVHVVLFHEVTGELIRTTNYINHYGPEHDLEPQTTMVQKTLVTIVWDKDGTFQGTYLGKHGVDSAKAYVAYYGGFITYV